MFYVNRVVLESLKGCPHGRGGVSHQGMLTSFIHLYFTEKGEYKETDEIIDVNTFIICESS